MPPRKAAAEGEPTRLPGTQTPEERKAAAEAKRKEFIARIAASKLKADQLPRDLLKILPFAVANMMLVDILNGKITVRTVGEAAQTAKLALEMGRLEMGDSTSAEPVTAEERQAKIKEATMLMDELKKRREILEQEADATPGPILPAAGSADAASG